MNLFFLYLIQILDYVLEVWPAFWLMYHAIVYNFSQALIALLRHFESLSMVANHACNVWD